MSDLLAEMLTPWLVKFRDAYESEPECADILADQIRAYYRERRPTREEIADRLKLFRKTKIGVGTVHHHTDALFALFDRVWEEK